jgi:hypothetical protein
MVEPQGPDEEALERVMFRATNRLAKWRALFTGWQLGTRSITDPEAQAVRDHREVTMLMRAEINALTWLLVERGVITSVDFTRAMAVEADKLNADYEERFPGVTASQDGLTYDLRATEWMKGWRP